VRINCLEMKEKDFLTDLGIDRKIILKWVLRKWECVDRIYLA
jgi:hypothetical protein